MRNFILTALILSIFNTANSQSKDHLKISIFSDDSLVNPLSFIKITAILKNISQEDTVYIFNPILTGRLWFLSRSNIKSPDDRVNVPGNRRPDTYDQKKYQLPLYPGDSIKATFKMPLQFNSKEHGKPYIFFKNKSCIDLFVQQYYIANDKYLRTESNSLNFCVLDYHGVDSLAYESLKTWEDPYSFIGLALPNNYSRYGQSPEGITNTENFIEWFPESQFTPWAVLSLAWSKYNIQVADENKRFYQPFVNEAEALLDSLNTKNNEELAAAVSLLRDSIKYYKIRLQQD
jgi:hypothetical protein